MLALHRWFSTLPFPALLTLAAGAVLVVSLLQRLPGLDATLWVLHFIPVSLAAWHGGRRWGAVLAILAAIIAVEGGSTGNGAMAMGMVPEWALRLGLMIGVAQVVGAPGASASGRHERPRFDTSTGLANSRALFELVSGEVERAQRYDRPFTLLYLAIDNLPVIHHRGGADGAEDALRRVAHHLKGSLRTVDLVARLREREFAVLLPETDAEAAGVVLGRVRRTLVAATADDPEGIDFAIGAVTWLRSELTVEALHQRVYQLMFAAQQEHAAIRHEVLDEDAVELVAHRHLSLRR